MTAAHRRPSGKEEGQALVFALLVLLMASAAAALLASDLLLRLRMAQQEARGVQLGALLDAAVSEALAELDRTATFTGAELHTFGGGQIASRVSRVPGSPDRYEIAAWAQSGPASRSAVVQARLIAGVPEVQFWRRTNLEGPP